MGLCLPSSDPSRVLLQSRWTDSSHNHQPLTHTSDMFRKIVLLSLASAAAAFAPSGSLPSLRRAPQRAACGLRMQASPPARVKMTHGWFTQLGAVDGSGRIDVNEPKMALDDAKDLSAMMSSIARTWTDRADLDGKGEIDYAECERLMSLYKLSDAQGGNL